MIFKKQLALLFILTISFSVFSQQSAAESKKIKVLNFASFHLSNSSDANTSPVDINNAAVKKEIDKIVQALVKFSPTIICVEVPVSSSDGTNAIYQKYKLDQSNTTNWAEEINSIAFEVGRLSGVENIYGVDNPIPFNYGLLMELAEASEEMQDFLLENARDLEEYNEKAILGKFHELNTEKYKTATLDFYNRLGLMHTQGNYEGATAIAEFYKRNLMIYSNINDIPKSQEDRILILMGGTHTAFLDFFMRNNPDYELVDARDYIPEN